MDRTHQNKGAWSIFVRLCHGMVLNITLAAGGASVASYGATTPRRMVMRHGGGEERKQCFAERSRVKRRFTKAQASRPWIHAAFGPCGHGLPCGNEYCRLCRSKTIRPAQHYQHGSMTEPILFVSIPSRCSGKGGGSAGYRGYHAESSPVSSRFPGVQTDVRSSLSQNGIMAQSSASVP